MSESFFLALGKLIEASAITLNLIEAAFGVQLHADKARSTPAYAFYLYIESARPLKDSPVKKIDFRTPFDPDRLGKEFLHVELKADPQLNADAVIARFGQPGQLRVPTPQEARGTGTAVTYIYSLKEWKVSFSFSAPPEENLLFVSMEHGPGK